MSTSSGQKRLLPKPLNFDVFQNEQNQAAKLQRLMPQLNKQNERDKATKRKQQKKQKNQRYRSRKNQLLEGNDLAQDFSIDIADWCSSIYSLRCWIMF